MSFAPVQFLLRQIIMRKPPSPEPDPPEEPKGDEGDTYGEPEPE